MGVAEHLRIDLGEYDARIRTFVPGYDELITNAADALHFVHASSPTVVDLGIGTGALAAACLGIRPDASLIGLDTDAGMLEAARSRLAGFPRVNFVQADFLSAELPLSDALVACLSLHHVPTAAAKRAFYRKCHDALRPSGILVTADCLPGRERGVAARHRESWLAHLQESYSRADAEGHLASWADEDVYFALEDELDWLRSAGFATETVWRREGFAVIIAFRQRSR